MTKDTLLSCIDYVAELGERFPDMSDADILESVAEYNELSAIPHSDSAIGRTLLRAYEDGTQEGIMCGIVWGILR